MNQISAGSRIESDLTERERERERDTLEKNNTSESDGVWADTASAIGRESDEDRGRDRESSGGDNTQQHSRANR